MNYIEQIHIVSALKSDATTLTEIAFAAKRYWNYPEDYYELWGSELTITSDYITQNTVYKVSYQGSIIGFYSVVEVKFDCYVGEILVKKGFWLEHIFILPKFHKMGVGRKLIVHAIEACKKSGIDHLLIFVDPYAKGFYDKIGAEYLYDSKSSIEGRMIPVYRLNVS